MLDYHVILDLLPQIAIFHFTGRLKPQVSLSGVQRSILLALGLQRKTLDDVEKELGLPASQLLAMFVKIVRKTSSHFRSLVEGAVAEGMPPEEAPLRSQAHDASAHDAEDGTELVADRFKPLEQDLGDELAEGGRAVDRELKEKQRALVDALPLDQ